MDKSKYTLGHQPGCGCSGSGLGSSTGYIHTGCGCQGGLGEASMGQPPKAPETKNDLINEAKKYINGEIPNKIKIAAGLGVVVLLLLTKRGK